MKLSNTMIMNEALLPSNKKAFTLAEVLITLSILGVVAALTIPSLVNRQSELQAIVKMKKAISQYEQVAEVYMAENETETFKGTEAWSCASLGQYFKMVSNNGDATGCVFRTADGVVWAIDGDGNAVVYDSAGAPKIGVAMWAKEGRVNDRLAASNIATPSVEAPTATGADAPIAVTTKPKFYNTTSLLRVNGAKDLSSAPSASAVAGAAAAD